MVLAGLGLIDFIFLTTGKNPGENVRIQVPGLANKRKIKGGRPREPASIALLCPVSEGMGPNTAGTDLTWGLRWQGGGSAERPRRAMLTGTGATSLLWTDIFIN